MLAWLCMLCVHGRSSQLGLAEPFSSACWVRELGLAELFTWSLGETSEAWLRGIELSVRARHIEMSSAACVRVGCEV